MRPLRSDAAADARARACAADGGEWSETLSHGEGEPLWQGFRAALSRIDRDGPAIAAALTLPQSSEHRNSNCHRVEAPIPASFTRSAADAVA
jgi:hypothetical protein